MIFFSALFLGILVWFSLEAWRLVEMWMEQESCKHEIRRCIHGEPESAGGFYRSACVLCGRKLGDLLVVCSITGRRHNE